MKMMNKYKMKMNKKKSSKSMKLRKDKGIILFLVLFKEEVEDEDSENDVETKTQQGRNWAILGRSMQLKSSTRSINFNGMTLSLIHLVVVPLCLSLKMSPRRLAVAEQDLQRQTRPLDVVEVAIRRLFNKNSERFHLQLRAEQEEEDKSGGKIGKHQG